MSRLSIGGQVQYNDFTPAAGTQVTIHELDSPGEHDRIFDATADAAGRFSGRSREWQDREGRLLGVDIPDILRLEFTARVDGQTHRGPFLRNGGRSVPIILPWGPPKPVSKTERELVQAILVSQDLVGAERALYEFIELSTETLTRTVLGPVYGRTTFLKGSAVTLDGLVAALGTAAGRPGVEAVDLLFTTHGTTDEVVFFEGRTAEEDLREALVNGLSPAKRAKLRIVFSTACFGATHLDTWIAAGFSEASGAEGIYADSAVSYAPFLTAWATEHTFADAVAAANAADVLDAADNAARAFYLAQNEPDNAAKIDSDRLRAGTGTTRIYSNP